MYVIFLFVCANVISTATNIAKMNSVRRDQLPTQNELEHDFMLVKHFQSQKQDYLLLDIWQIVLSYFFGFRPIVLSIPISALYHRDRMIDWCKWKNNYMTYFYGRENGSEFSFFANGMECTISGHFPLHIWSICFVRMNIIAIQPNTRFLIGIRSTQECLEYLDKHDKIFTWHRDICQTFDSAETARQFMQRTNNQYPVYRTMCGLFGRIP